MSLRNDNVIEFDKMNHAEALSDKEYIRKFRMFFTGLIFAIISFIGSHPISTSNGYLKIVEITALTSLLISGFLLLAKLSGVYVNSAYNDLKKKGINFFSLFLILTSTIGYCSFLE